MLVAYGSVEKTSGFRGWWESQPQAVKVTLGISAAALATMLVAVVARGPEKRAMTPNKQGKKSARRNGKMCMPNRAVKRPRLSCQAAPSVPSCRCSPPKRYRKTGARKAKDYAFPECFMYPIHKPQYVRTSASRYGKFAEDIPTQFRGKVKARIRKAEKKFGIGEFRVR